MTDIFVVAKHPKSNHFETAKVLSHFDRHGWYKMYRVEFVSDKTQSDCIKRDCTILGKRSEFIENLTQLPHTAEQDAR